MPKLRATKLTGEDAVPPIDAGERARLMDRLVGLQRDWSDIARSDKDGESAAMADVLRAVLAARRHGPTWRELVRASRRALASVHEEDRELSRRPGGAFEARKAAVRMHSARPHVMGKVDALVLLARVMEQTEQDGDALAEKLLATLQSMPSPE